MLSSDFQATCVTWFLRVQVNFLWVLWFTPTFQKHFGMYIGCTSGHQPCFCEIYLEDFSFNRDHAHLTIQSVSSEIPDQLKEVS